MLDQQNSDFNQRLSQIERRHRQSAKGYVTLVERDGLLLPAQSRFRRRTFPLRAIVLVLVGFTLFKAVIFGQIGAERYGQQLAIMQHSSPLDKAGAWALHPDPVTLWLSALFTRQS